MKKHNLLSLALIAILLIFNVSCGSNSESSTQDDEMSETDEGSMTEVAMSVYEQDELDALFTSLAETFTTNFDKNKVSDEQMIQFAIYTMYINDYEYFETDESGNYAIISEQDVQSTAKYFFGKEISKNGSFQDIEYEDGIYAIPQASGESINFAKVTQLFELGNNEFLAYFTNYSASSGWDGSITEDPSEWTGDDLPTENGEKTAIIKLDGQNEDAHYVILSYEDR